VVVNIIYQIVTTTRRTKIVAVRQRHRRVALYGVDQEPNVATAEVAQRSAALHCITLSRK